LPTQPNPSGNIANALNDIVHIKSTPVLNIISDIVGSLADASGAIGGVISLFQTLLGKPDEIMVKLNDILNAINGLVKEFRGDEKGNQILTRNTTLIGYCGSAKAKLDALQAEISANPTPAEVVDFIGPCIEALEHLGAGSADAPDYAWNMNLDWQVYWTDQGLYLQTCYTEVDKPVEYDVGYGLQAPDPNSDGVTVFVYTGSLPLYAFTIAIFLAVAGSLDPKFTLNYGDTVLRPAAAVLRSKYEKIVEEGVTQLSPPDWTDHAALLSEPCSTDDLREGRLHGIRRPVSGNVLPASSDSLIEYGVVEKFSGYSSIGNNYRLDVPWSLGPFDPAFFNKLRLRLLKRRKNVYTAVGMPSVWQMINKLNALVGDAPLPYANEADWSIQECIRVTRFPLEHIFDPPSGYLPKNLGLRAFADFVIQTQPFDTPYPVSTPRNVPISLRQLLTNFNDNSPVDGVPS
jgi:hypothetical protein